MRVVEISGRGRGIVAERKYRCGSVVHISPIVEVRLRDARGILQQYIYSFGRSHALAFGFGSLFNHSRHPTLNVYQDVERRELMFRARRNIVIGDELTIDYGYTPVGYDGN